MYAVMYVCWDEHSYVAVNVHVLYMCCNMNENVLRNEYIYVFVMFVQCLNVGMYV